MGATVADYKVWGRLKSSLGPFGFGVQGSKQMGIPGVGSAAPGAAPKMIACTKMARANAARKEGIGEQRECRRWCRIAVVSCVVTRRSWLVCPSISPTWTFISIPQGSCVRTFGMLARDHLHQHGTIAVKAFRPGCKPLPVIAITM